MKIFYTIICIITLSVSDLHAQISSAYIDSLVVSCLKTFNVAGADPFQCTRFVKMDER